MAPIDNANEFSSNNQQDKNKKEIVFGLETAEKFGDSKLKQEAIAEIQEKEMAISEDSDEVSLQEQAQTSPAEKEFEIKVENERISTQGNAKSISEKQLVNNQNEVESDAKAKETSSINKPNYYDYFAGILEQEGENVSQAEDLEDDVLSATGNVALLADTEMREISVEQPFSKLKSKELKLANEFLGRMNKQVLAIWKNPYKGNHVYKGVVKLDLDENGYLKDVYIYRASGHPALDNSVLKAITSVIRFQVPENKILANRYYTNLSFYYSSTENKTELMPFEKDAE